jgi:CheY-like chemotaxis protein
VSKIVLCVDDSATMQQVADITFRGTEFTYVGARSYEEGLEKAKAQKPAIVLVDAQLGSKSGYDLCLALKNDGATANTPIAILVGNSAAYDANRGAQVGADASLPKPWDTQTMLEKVVELVGKGAAAKPGAAAASPGPAMGSAPAQPLAAAAKSAPAQVPGPAAAAAAAAAGAAAQPPRSATIMGMPTIKMPAGVAPPATAPMPSKTTVMAVPPIAPSGGAAAPAAAPAMRAPAAPSAPAAPAAAPAPVMAGYNRPPMVAGSPTKRSQIVERTLAKMAARLAEASGLEPGSPELAALLKLSTEVVERIVWEVVPDLAEQIIRENLQELASQRRS